MNRKAKILLVIRWPQRRAVAGAAEILYQEGRCLRLGSLETGAQGKLCAKAFLGNTAGPQDHRKVKQGRRKSKLKDIHL